MVRFAMSARFPGFHRLDMAVPTKLNGAQSSHCCSSMTWLIRLVAGLAGHTSECVSMRIRIISGGVTAIALTWVLCMLKIDYIEWVHPSRSVACLRPCLILTGMTLGAALRAVVAASR